MFHVRRPVLPFVFTASLLLAMIVGSAIAPAPVAAMSGAAVTAQHEHRTAPEEASEASRRSVHEEPLWVTLARLFNFAVLAGTLVYFLRSPLARYMIRRGNEIRADLAKAAAMREAAERQLAEVDARVKALPEHLEAVKRRGAEEIAAEEARIRAAAEAERKRLVDQANREIDLQVRIAERDLRQLAAALAVQVATERIRRTITTDDQVRLFDRYLSQIGPMGRAS